MNKLTRKQRKMLLRIVAAAVLLLLVKLASPYLESVQGAFITSPAGGASISPAALTALFSLLYLVPYLIIGWDVLYKAVRNIAHGQVFDENFLMALATVGAFGTGE